MSDAFCEKPTGVCSGVGRCMKPLPVITTHLAPVCACDGKTYGKALARQAEKISKAHDGECGPQ